jgi:HPt (histidine-containing phosphotransfer) domain-containing protein
VPAYLENCRENVLAIHEALARDDLARVVYLAHNMRGSGGAFGFQIITDIATTLEAAAGQADSLAAGVSATALSACLDQIRADRSPSALIPV